MITNRFAKGLRLFVLGATLLFVSLGTASVHAQEGIETEPAALDPAVKVGEFQHCCKRSET